MHQLVDLHLLPSCCVITGSTTRSHEEVCGGRGGHANDIAKYAVLNCGARNFLCRLLGAWHLLEFDGEA